MAFKHSNPRRGITNEPRAAFVAKRKKKKFPRVTDSPGVGRAHVWIRVEQGSRAVGDERHQDNLTEPHTPCFHCHGGVTKPLYGCSSFDSFDAFH